MNEEFLHYIWKYKLFEKETLITTNGQPVEILSTGFQSSNAGADFINAKVKIGDTLWAGNVEIHIRSSDWNRHLHQNNNDYNNVILHVVYHHDQDIYNAQQQAVQTVVLQFKEEIFERYKQLKNTNQTIACADSLPTIDSFTLTHWREKLLIERFENKTQIIENLLETTKNDWNESFYIFLARAFGFNINAYAFEMLAKSLSQKILAKHKNQLFTIEALLFGQAGMLEKQDIEDQYYRNLQKEYIFLQKKYQLKPVESYLWKFLRLRPINFPTLRISQFAVLIFKSHSLFSQIIKIKNLEDLEKIFDLQTSEYWQTHYTFGKISPKKKKTLGKTAVHLLIINSIIPFLFFYAKKIKNTVLEDLAFEWLEKLPSEKNKILEEWKNLGLKIENAAHSQAFLQLSNQYCALQKCLDCAIGNRILKNL